MPPKPNLSSGGRNSPTLGNHGRKAIKIFSDIEVPWLVNYPSVKEEHTVRRV